MSDTTNEQEVVQEQPEVTEQQAAPQPNPQDGLEQRNAALAAEAKQLREDLQRAAQAMAQMAITQPPTQAQTVRQAPAPDPLEALKDQVAPEVIAAINAKFAQAEAAYQRQLVQVSAKANQQVLAAQADQYGSAVKQLAERVYAEEVSRGFDPSTETVLNYAIGKAVREGTYIPGGTVAPAAQAAPARQPTLAPQAPVLHGVPPAPRGKGTINQALSGSDYVAAVEAAGLDDFPI